MTLISPRQGTKTDSREFMEFRSNCYLSHSPGGGAEGGTLRAIAMGVGSLANGTSDSHALRASGRATRIETL